MQFLIDRYLFLLVHLKGLVTHGFRRTTYGQWAEDLLIQGYATEKSGMYVDVGAFHPMHYSNTYLLYKRGWSGVAIDPNSSTKALFRLHRPRDTCVVSGVGSERATLPYYVFNHQSCNTFSNAHKERMLARPFMRLVRTEQVPIAPLSDILNEHAKGTRIDVMNIDVEGMNLAVLESNDWTVYAPRVLCVEDDDLVVGVSTVTSPIHAYLSGRGYVLRARAGQSSIYIHGT
jgi:FkbM family methyltransferase